MSVNEKIRLIREAKNLTQEQVAEKLGVSQSAYGDIERGEIDPKLSKLKKIAEIFEIELSELVDLTEKGTLNINFPCQQNKARHENNVYIGSSNAELKEQLLINKFQKEEIEILKREIEHLNEIIALLKTQSQ